MLTLLYRGPLQSCNYRCSYCPFAGGRASSAEELRFDEAVLGRFVGWASAQTEPRLSIFFTPRGEALVHQHYQRALATLSKLPRVARVAVQTNLSMPDLHWLESCDVSRLGIWATYHPAWANRERFLALCRELLWRRVRFSVGMVGLPEYLDEIRTLRDKLPRDIYLWINAAKDRSACGDPAFVAEVEAIDPLFRYNLQPQPSRGLLCRAGETLLSVDGEGSLRRCHFLPEVLGNLYCNDVSSLLALRPCPAATCRCHIGYVHLPALGLERVFGDGILERVPAVPWHQLKTSGS